MLMFRPAAIRYAVHCVAGLSWRLVGGGQKVPETGFFRLLLGRVVVIIAAVRAAGLYLGTSMRPQYFGAEAGGGFAR